MPTEGDRTAVRVYRFQMADAFPSKSVVARWILYLSIIENDLNAANLGMFNYLNDETDPFRSRWVYYSGLATSHLREAVKFLWNSRKIPEVRAFIETLPEELRREYEQIADSLFLKDTPILKRIIDMRNQFFHYPEGVKELMDSRMEDVLRSAIKSPGQVVVTQTMHTEGVEYDFRYEFADRFHAVYSFGLVARDARELESFMEDLADAMTRVMRFANGVVTGHLRQYWSLSGE